MDDNQKEFLDRLDALLTEYSIDRVKYDTAIRFISNGSELRFDSYSGGRFEKVETTTPTYTPPEPDTEPQGGETT